MSVVVYYWGGMLGRSSAAQRMLTQAGVSYEVKSDFGEIAQKSAVFGAQGTNFAPPIVADGDQVISQSIAVAMHVGQKCGFDKGISSMPKAIQFMMDIFDFIGELSTASKSAADLHAFLNGKPGSSGGGRATMWLSMLERAVAGPLFFGEEPTFVDFFLAQSFDWHSAVTFAPLEKAGGKNVLKDYPYLAYAWEGVKGLDKVKAMTLPVCKDDYQGIVKEAIAQEVVAGKFGAESGGLL